MTTSYCNTTIEFQGLYNVLCFITKVNKRRFSILDDFIYTIMAAVENIYACVKELVQKTTDLRYYYILV